MRGSILTASHGVGLSPSTVITSRLKNHTAVARRTGAGPHLGAAHGMGSRHSTPRDTTGRDSRHSSQSSCLGRSLNPDGATLIAPNSFAGTTKSTLVSVEIVFSRRTVSLGRLYSSNPTAVPKCAVPIDGYPGLALRWVTFSLAPRSEALTGRAGALESQLSCLHGAKTCAAALLAVLKSHIQGWQS